MAIKVDVINDISPRRGLPVSPRSRALCRQLSWTSGAASAKRRVSDRDRLRGQIVLTTQAGRPQECALWAGETAGGINEILLIREIMRRLIAETEAALRRLGRNQA